MTGLFVLLVISYNLGLSWWPFQVAMVITGFLAPVLWIFGWTDSIVKRRRADYEQEHGAYRSPRGRRRRTTRPLLRRPTQGVGARPLLSQPGAGLGIAHLRPVFC